MRKLIQILAIAASLLISQSFAYADNDSKPNKSDVEIRFEKFIKNPSKDTFDKLDKIANSEKTTDANAKKIIEWLNSVKETKKVTIRFVKFDFTGGFNNVGDNDIRIFVDGELVLKLDDIEVDEGEIDKVRYNVVEGTVTWSQRLREDFLQISFKNHSKTWFSHFSKQFTLDKYKIFKDTYQTGKCEYDLKEDRKEKGTIWLEISGLPVIEK